MFDFTELPKKYVFNQEKLTEDKYIDDNSLFVYYCISRGIFDPYKNTPLSFFHFTPFEWSSIDFVSFLISVTLIYKLPIKNIKTIEGAIQDDYEISTNPIKYTGAYNWILELKDKHPERDEVALFDKFIADEDY